MSPVTINIVNQSSHYRKAGHEGKVEIGMDVAASEFFKEGKYDLDFKNADSKEADHLSSDALEQVYHEFIANYPVVSIEDPYDQDDWNAWSKLTAATDIQVGRAFSCDPFYIVL